MQQNTSRIARDQLLAVLQEAFEGPRQSWSYFTDPGPTSGFLGTVEALSAEEVSRPFGPSGNTIAAHAYHAAFGLAVSSAWIGGDRTPPNWRDSWKLKTVDDATWAKLREQLQREYEDLTRVIESIDLSDPEALGGAVGAIAHTASRSDPPGAGSCDRELTEADVAHGASHRRSRGGGAACWIAAFLFADLGRVSLPYG